MTRPVSCRQRAPLRLVQDPLGENGSSHCLAGRATPCRCSYVLDDTQVSRRELLAIAELIDDVLVNDGHSTLREQGR